ncbi:type II secretion system minor pseudopilin GspJ [Candidatus Enterovibrio altilux]|uniref:Type II secretion system protein J n=2 Tax=Candidatus Enterovibrio altilux TaxID=1927128 RepID=A0A291B920_9GAMM|nr:type II secretion system minor pseudopilin GspJ [Candidatus Enterovibrio luxaltus]ATF09483.1 General secretion pathway protein J [Candidatus Enterovibrio luxaltus]
MFQPINIDRRAKKFRLPKRWKIHGFTLVEVMLALMIFAMLSISANQIFHNVNAANQQTKKVSDALIALQRSIVIMDSDFRQILARYYRNGGNESDEILLEMGDNLLNSEAAGIRFVRGGWANPQQLLPRGEVVKVGYRLQNKKLERIRWMFADDSSSTEPAFITLMEDVTNLQFEVFDDARWQTHWNTPHALPEAIRVTLRTDHYGDFTRIYLLPSQVLSNTPVVKRQ